MRFVVGIASTALALCTALAACSSWDTGSEPGDGPEKACLATIEAFARAAERCGQDYATSYDALVQKAANGDCKNVRTIRDETALRMTCIPYVMTEPCAEVLAGTSDPTCSKQLQRTASFKPSL